MIPWWIAVIAFILGGFTVFCILWYLFKDDENPETFEP